MLTQGSLMGQPHFMTCRAAWCRATAGSRLENSSEMIEAALENVLMEKHTFYQGYLHTAAATLNKAQSY